MHFAFAKVAGGVSIGQRKQVARNMRPLPSKSQLRTQRCHNDNLIIMFKSWWQRVIIDGRHFAQMKRHSRAHGVVVSHPLRMRKALGSNPSVSITFARAGRLTRLHGNGSFTCCVRATRPQTFRTPSEST